MTGRPRPIRLAAATAAAGGLLVAAGAAMPWLTLYGGLHPLRGVMGLYGQLLLAAGIAAVAGAAFLPRSPRRGGTVLIAAAAAVLGFTAWLVADALPGMLAAMGTNPFLVAQPAAGPYVVLAGGTLLLAAGAAARSRASVSG